MIHEITGYDLILTGPPYGLRLNYGVGIDDWKPDREFWKILYKNSTENCKLITNVGTYNMCWWLDEIRAAGWIYHHTGCYYNTRKEERTFDRFPHCWEPIFFFSKNDTFELYKDNTKLYTDVYKHYAPSGQSHPCPNDLSAFKHVLELIEFETLFDPFSGIGTSLLCARDKGKKSIGIEQNSKFCDEFIAKLK